MMLECSPRWISCQFCSLRVRPYPSFRTTAWNDEFTHSLHERNRRENILNNAIIRTAQRKYHRLLAGWRNCRDVFSENRSEQTSTRFHGNDAIQDTYADDIEEHCDGNRMGLSKWSMLGAFVAALIALGNGKILAIAQPPMLSFSLN